MTVLETIKMRSPIYTSPREDIDLLILAIKKAERCVYVDTIEYTPSKCIVNLKVNGRIETIPLSIFPASTSDYLSKYFTQLMDAIKERNFAGTKIPLTAKTLLDSLLGVLL